MLNTFSETVGAMDIKMTKQAVERSRPVRMVEYPSHDEFVADVKLVLNEEDDEFEVSWMANGGRASSSGVQIGHIIYKVNREKEAWRFETVEETIYEGIQEDERRGTVSIVFKERQESGLAGMFSMSNANIDSVRPTVKNFWGT